LNKKLHPSAYEFEKYDVNDGEWRWMTNKMHPKKGTIEFRNTHELVRRQNVEELIKDRIDYVYEEEHNADISQERACVEILQKLLEDVQNE